MSGKEGFAAGEGGWCGKVSGKEGFAAGEGGWCGKVSGKGGFAAGRWVVREMNLETKFPTDI